MKSSGFRVITSLIFLVGAILGIVLGFTCQVDVDDGFWSEKFVFNVGLMLETWIVFDIISAFFLWLTTALEKLENIENKICVENIIYNQGKFPRVPSANEWACPKCGKINQNYVGTCGCGEKKPN